MEILGCLIFNHVKLESRGLENRKQKKRKKKRSVECQEFYKFYLKLSKFCKSLAGDRFCFSALEITD